MTDRAVELGRRDPVARASSEILGGPAGRHALPLGMRWPHVSALLVLGSLVPLVLDVMQKNNCISVGWRQPDQLWRACYADAPVVWSTSGLEQGQFPWSQASAHLDQPIGRGLALWLVGLVVPEGSSVLRQQVYFLLWAVLLTLALAGAIVLVTRLTTRATRDGSAGWAATHLALSPLLVTTAFVSDDLLIVLLVVLGARLWATGRSSGAGVAWAAAAWWSPWALLVPVAAGLVAAGRQAGAARRGAGADPRAAGADPRAVAGIADPAPGEASVKAMALACAGALALLLLPWLTVRGAFAGYESVVAAAPGYGSVLRVPALLGRPLPQAAVTGIALGGWALALAVGVVRSGLLPGVRAARGSWVGTATLMLLVVWLTAPVLPVQTGLWWLPLLALSRAPWRAHLTLALVETVHFGLVWMHAGVAADPDRGLPAAGYAIIVVLRALTWAWVGVQVARAADRR